MDRIEIFPGHDGNLCLLVSSGGRVKCFSSLNKKQALCLIDDALQQNQKQEATHD